MVHWPLFSRCVNLYFLDSLVSLSLHISVSFSYDTLSLLPTLLLGLYTTIPFLDELTFIYVVVSRVHDWPVLPW